MATAMMAGSSAAQLPSNAGEPRPRRLTRWAAFAAALAAALLPQVHACGLEPTINGGIQVSHPKALEVAVAVANARREGVLPHARPETAPNDVVLERMVADLKQLQGRLQSGRAAGEPEPASFSLVLVGPGLWSHFHADADSILAEYHTDGPRVGEAVVVTHHVVLRALLSGSLSLERATELGLIAYSGPNIGTIQRAIKNSFRTQA